MTKSTKNIGVVSALAFLAAMASSCSDDNKSSAASADSSRTVVVSAAGQASSEATHDYAKLTPEDARRCFLLDCPPGTKVITGPEGDGAYFACISESVSDYANMALGLVSAQHQMTGTMPNINPDTGEPEYGGNTAKILASYRARAGVRTLDEAIAMCRPGAFRRRLTVINFQKDRISTWVYDNARHEAYWLPTSEIDRATK